VPVIDRDSCMHFLKDACKSCENFCGPKAINYEQEDEIVDVEVGAVIMAPGYEPFDARIKEELGYGRYPNVITALEFERVLSASGPFLGKVLRPYDKKVPRKIGFIQCVGSREDPHRYCSRVCCAGALKHALKLKELSPDTDVYVLYRDLRAYGFKEKYYRQARQAGVIFIQYDRDQKPEVVPATGADGAGNVACVKGYDPILGRQRCVFLFPP